MSEPPKLFSIKDRTPFILGTECTKCHYSWFPPLFHGCERCGAYGTDLVSREFSAKGRLVSFASIYEAKDQSFILATIELNDGPVLQGILKHAETLVVGDSVEAYAVNQNEEAVLRFRGIIEANA